jgi:uncharacterized coiled-coil DUF342 family protein
MTDTKQATKTSPTKAPRQENDQGEGYQKKPYNQEENKENKGQYVHKPKKNYYKERIVVTLETEVPDLPKKNELHPKPDDDHFQNELDKIQKSIDDLYKQMTDITRESRNKNYFPQDKTFEDLISLLKVKQEEKRRAYDEYQAVVTERDMYKKQVDDYFDRGNEYRYKMKIPGTKKVLMAQLEELRNLQSKGSISLAEEKKVIKEISDLEKSLPFAGPLEELEEQSKDVKELLKAAKQKVGGKSEISKRLRDECKLIQEKIDKMREDFDKKKEETTPAIDKMKEEYRSKINALKEKRKVSYEKHNEAWRNYEEQQAEIERIKLIKRKKEKLIREEQRRKRDEEWRKQRESEQEENKEVPYRAQIELCELLINYCHKVSPVVEEASENVNKKDKSQVIEEAMQSNEWKAAKGQYITSKKETVDDFFAGKGKKKGGQKKQATKTEDNSAQPINHQIETLGYFDEIKVSPPLYTDKLPATLKVLQEKKDYFKKLSEEAVAADENRKNLSEEERKKLDEEDKQRKEKEQDLRKEQKRSVAKPKFDLESEQDFPRM